MTTNLDLAPRVANLSVFQDLAYGAADKAWLLKPEGLSRATVTGGRAVLGPFSYSTLRALVGIGLPSRFDHAQEVWRRLFRFGYPTEEQREPGGEPNANVRSGAAYWELLALTATVLQDLAGLVDAIGRWRAAGTKIGPGCDIGVRYLDADVQAAAVFARVASPESVTRLFAYPDAPRVAAAVHDDDEARALSEGVVASAQYLAEFFAFARTIYTDRLHRTQIRWKHRAAVFTPDVAPLWLAFTPRTRERLEPMLRRGIAVLDTRRTRSIDGRSAIGRLIIWPMTRESIGAHREILTTALVVTEGLAASVVLAAENGRYLPLLGANRPEPGSVLECALATHGGTFYSLLD